MTHKFADKFRTMNDLLKNAKKLISQGDEEHASSQLFQLSYDAKELGDKLHDTLNS